MAKPGALSASSIALIPVENIPAREFYDLSTRQQLSHQIKQCGKIALMVQRNMSQSKSSVIKALDKRIYSLPGDVTWIQLIGFVRKLLEKQHKFSQADALYLFCEKEVDKPNEKEDKVGSYKMYMISGACTLKCVQSAYVHSDGFIYVYYASENAFGST